ncbi:MAG: YdcF family protein [Gemmatimonadota bacterium]|nr:YdcF family protein [Gemmatimonadota bacterium]
MTTPIVNDPARSSRDEIYGSPPAAATHARPSAVARPSLWWLATEGALLGVAFWLLLLVLGVPWVFHIGGFDGLFPATLLGIVMGLAGLRGVLAAVVAAQAVLLVIVGYTPLIVEPARSLIRNDPLPSKADAIVVLAAGTSDDGLILPQATDRLLKGLELLNRGVAPVLVLPREADSVGTRLVTQRDDHHRIVALVRGAQSKVVFSGLTHSTRDEAVRTAMLFRARGWKRVVAVTSPLHTRRTCATFEKVGIVVSCHAAESREIALITLKKPEDRVRAFQAWLYETAGTIRYKQLGWL